MLGRRLDPSELVDHQNHDPWDNRRENLRLATAGENCFNRVISRRKRGKYKGVYEVRPGRFKPMIQVDRKNIDLGLYDTDLEAAYVYDQFALVLHGDFAYLNVLDC